MCKLTKELLMTYTQNNSTGFGPSWKLLLDTFPEAIAAKDNKQVYALLQSKMRKFRDYAGIPCVDNAEPLVAIEQTDNLRTRQIDPRMLVITGTEIYVRTKVAEKLASVAEMIAKTSGFALEVVYGYRDLAIQQSTFDDIISEIKAKGFEGTEAELFEEAHRSIAVPSVAGHPTGGAVDVQIWGQGKPLKMGTDIWDFSPDSYTFSPFIDQESWGNRQLLRSVMQDFEFTPFDGEWWHFSYGDKEWAAANNQPQAIYEQVTYRTGMVQ